MFFYQWYKTNRFHAAMRLFSNRSQRRRKCGKNIIETLGYRLEYHFLLIINVHKTRGLIGWNSLLYQRTQQCLKTLSCLSHFCFELKKLTQSKHPLWLRQTQCKRAFCQQFLWLTETIVYNSSHVKTVRKWQILLDSDKDCNEIKPLESKSIAKVQFLIDIGRLVSQSNSH